MPSVPTQYPLVDTASTEERAAAGKAARERVPRSSHGDWERQRANRNEFDYAALADSARSGRIEVETDLL